MVVGQLWGMLGCPCTDGFRGAEYSRYEFGVQGCRNWQAAVVGVGHGGPFEPFVGNGFRHIFGDGLKLCPDGIEALAQVSAAANDTQDPSTFPSAGFDRQYDPTAGSEFLDGPESYAQEGDVLCHDAVPDAGMVQADGPRRLSK